MEKTIGIGCTTYKRPDCLTKWKEQIAKHTCMDNVLIHIAEDTDIDRRGIAFRKNENLRALQQCDVVFLFDDDCFPVKDNWIDFFIENAGQNHVMFLSDRLHNFSHQRDNVRFYKDSGGVFLYIPKSALEYVGAFNEKFNMYGFEHCDWSMRYADGHKIFMMIEGTEKYIYAHDYSTANHVSSISNEDKKKYFDINFPKFVQPIKQIYISL